MYTRLNDAEYVGVFFLSKWNGQKKSENRSQKNKKFRNHPNFGKFTACSTGKEINLKEK